LFPSFRFESKIPNSVGGAVFPHLRNSATFDHARAKLLDIS